MEDSSPQRRPQNAVPLLRSPLSDPGLLSSSPQNYFMERSQSLNELTGVYSSSPSGVSEIDVILDDGSQQKRTVSLSTLPGNDHHDSSDESIIDDSTPLLKSHKDIYHAIGYSSKDAPSSSSSSDDDSDEPFFPVTRYKKRRPSQANTHKKQPGFFHLTTAQRSVLKCSFAYLLGSLFTFVPYLNGWIGNNHTSSHLVATATVFFNPAKTLGGMVEAAAYGWGYVLFANVICWGSMITTDFFVDRNHYLIAHLISLFVWLAGSTFIVSFLKAHWNKPPVGTASSLCFITIFIIVVREGSVNRGDFDTTRINQITGAVATGTLITVACCILFWPVSAAKKLKNNLDETLGSYRVLLKLLTKTFLLDDDLPEFKANRTLQTAIQAHQSSFTALQKSLAEAKLETFWNTNMRGKHALYDSVIKSMQRLAQHMGGLRSSCGIQFEIMGSEKTKQYKEMARKKRKMYSAFRQASNLFVPQKPAVVGETNWNVRAGYRRRRFQEEIRRQKASDQLVPSTSQPEAGSTLVDFIQTIRGPLKSLAFTCKQTLLHLQNSFSAQPATSLYLLRSNLQKAIVLFESSQNEAIQKLYSSYNHSNGTLMGEDIFLVYFFVFNMTEFARELIVLVESVERLNEANKHKMGLITWILAWIKKKKGAPKKVKKSPGFVPNERNTVNTLHTPTPTTTWRKFFINVWYTFSLFKLQKIRYATKATVATILLASFAFIDSTKAWFIEWRMEWALITLMVVMTPTVGGTNIVAVYRIFSTIFGCYTAMIFYMLFPGNMYALALLTWLFSIPNFWIILHHKHGKFGQFQLLAYNLVMLNKFNDRDTNQIEVWWLATVRCTAILAGVVLGLIATAYVWPYEARVELRKGLSDFLLRLAWLYQKLVSIHRDYILPATPDNLVDLDGLSETQVLTLDAQKKMATQSFMDLELGLQRSLLELQSLLSQTPNEPRLKGAFPVDTYRDMLLSCQNIVDRFLSMRTIILKDDWYEQVQHDLMLPLSLARREMVGNVILYFYLLASALRLKTPMPPYFPPARKAWQSLLVQLREMPIEKTKRLIEKNNVYIFYYAYVTLMEDIIRELDKLGNNMTLLFGALVPSNQWEQLFDEEDHP
ncbi:Fusaric acid resistance protein-like-domain-containing protein [Pilobolus umbonatus]|nr:Fusaric acid resistance protein-like-domain-containing protein [Pilobolus umbonatus]